MSPSVGNFVHDLVEMAKAMETLPQVQAELAEAHAKTQVDGETIMQHELRIIELKKEIEALNNRVRDAEVARDDAELRFLELDEKANTVLAHISDALTTVEIAYKGAKDMFPPKPEPQPEPKAEPAKTPDPYNNPADRHDMFPEQGYYAPLPDAPQGQSESNPTSNASSPNFEVNHPVTNAQEPVTASAEPKPTPFTGKYYYDHPVYVSLHDWIEGGGTEENYYRSKPTRDYSAQYDTPPDEPKF